MPRSIWKGAISFGLVHVPVALYPASHEEDIDFDWLDKRTMDPVGYKRVNKRTVDEIAKDDIVRGVKHDSGEYVVLSDDEIRAAYPKTTQTIDIQAFVKAQEVGFVHLEKPYLLEPAGRGADKVYALLREAMVQQGVIGIARLVIHNKEHLAGLVPVGQALMLETLRWSSEIRPLDDLALPAAGKAGLKEAELKMAGELIGGMTEAFKPDAYADTFGDAIRALVARKAKAGDTEKVEPLEEVPEGLQDGKVVDLVELLKKSLGQRAEAPKASARRSTAKAQARPTRKRA